jgi:hyperosmotically inducible protein
MKHLGVNMSLLAALLSTVSGCASTATHKSAGQHVDDTAITAGVKAAMVKEPELTASDINVETLAGVVQLSGFVSSPDSVATAASVARTVKGVKSVKNELRLK